MPFGVSAVHRDDKPMGFDFRPSYLQLGKVAEEYAIRHVCAFTATAITAGNNVPANIEETSRQDI